MILSYAPVLHSFPFHSPQRFRLIILSLPAYLLPCLPPCLPPSLPLSLPPSLSPYPIPISIKPEAGCLVGYLILQRVGCLVEMGDREVGG